MSATSKGARTPSQPVPPFVPDDVPVSRDLTPLQQLSQDALQGFLRSLRAQAPEPGQILVDVAEYIDMTVLNQLQIAVPLLVDRSFTVGGDGWEGPARHFARPFVTTICTFLRSLGSKDLTHGFVLLVARLIHSQTQAAREHLKASTHQLGAQLLIENLSALFPHLFLHGPKLTAAPSATSLPRSTAPAARLLETHKRLLTRHPEALLAFLYACFMQLVPAERVQNPTGFALWLGTVLPDFMVPSVAQPRPSHSTGSSATASSVAASPASSAAAETARAAAMTYLKGMTAAAERIARHHGGYVPDVVLTADSVLSFLTIAHDPRSPLHAMLKPYAAPLVRIVFPPRAPRQSALSPDEQRRLAVAVCDVLASRPQPAVAAALHPLLVELMARRNSDAVYAPLLQLGARSPPALRDVMRDWVAAQAACPPRGLASMLPVQRAPTPEGPAAPWRRLQAQPFARFLADASALGTTLASTAPPASRRAAAQIADACRDLHQGMGRVQRDSRAKRGLTALLVALLVALLYQTFVVAGCAPRGRVAGVCFTDNAGVAMVQRHVVRPAIEHVRHSSLAHVALPPVRHLWHRAHAHPASHALRHAVHRHVAPYAVPAYDAVMAVTHRATERLAWHVLPPYAAYARDVRAVLSATAWHVHAFVTRQADAVVDGASQIGRRGAETAAALWNTHPQVVAVREHVAAHPAAQQVQGWMQTAVVPVVGPVWSRLRILAPCAAELARLMGSALALRASVADWAQWRSQVAVLPAALRAGAWPPAEASPVWPAPPARPAPPLKA